MHNLDITAGQASFVSAREDAWHGLGTVLPDAFTAEGAMTAGLLGGWNVRKTPTMALLEDGSQIPIPERYAVVRDNPVIPGQVDVIGNVGSRYHVVQNEEHAAILNAFVEESGARFETAGALKGGSQVFITMKLPGHLNIGGVDRVENFVAAINSHDGSLPFTLMVTPVRIVCQNTLNVAFRGRSTSFSARHTVGAQKNLVAQARSAMDVTFNFLEGFQEEAEALINATLSQQRFEEIIEREFGAPEDSPKAVITRAENRLDEMARLFADSSTHEGVRNTAWAGFNALVEWADHFSPARGESPETTRMTRSLFDPTFKQSARKLMLSLV